jgi:hypothetical protein
MNLIYDAPWSGRQLTYLTISIDSPMNPETSRLKTPELFVTDSAEHIRIRLMLLRKTMTRHHPKSKPNFLKTLFPCENFCLKKCREVRHILAGHSSEGAAITAYIIDSRRLISFVTVNHLKKFHIYFQICCQIISRHIWNLASAVNISF